jgi:hypothetical protein
MLEYAVKNAVTKRPKRKIRSKHNVLHDTAVDEAVVVVEYDLILILIALPIIITIILSRGMLVKKYINRTGHTCADQLVVEELVVKFRVIAPFVQVIPPFIYNYTLFFA